MNTFCIRIVRIELSDLASYSREGSKKTGTFDLVAVPCKYRSAVFGHYEYIHLVLFKLRHVWRLVLALLEFERFKVVLELR